jgi:hypothetical protein
MTTALNQPIAMKLFSIILVAGLIISCTAFNQGRDDPSNRQSYQTTALDEARALYELGDYAEALDKFSFLATSGETDEIVFEARLGESCCRLMLANTTSEYYTAIMNWKELAGSISETYPVEFEMIDPVIVRLTTKQIRKILDFERVKATKKEIVEQPGKKKVENQEAKAELSALKKEMEKTDNLQLQLEKMEAENKSLKEKIKALEAIDQNIQKKKTEIESPGE